MPTGRPSSALLLTLAALAACAAPRGPVASAAPVDGPAATQGPPPTEGRAVLLRFARAVEDGRWAEAWPLLSERWRGATSAERLGSDYRGAGPVAREAAERVVALLEAGAGLSAGSGTLRLPVGPGRAARLVEEAGGWRVDALE